MPKTLSKEVPENYALCLRDDCPCGSTCLRRLACGSLMKHCIYLRVINPDRCAPGATCPYYRDSAPVLYARGFRGMQSRMFPAQYRMFRENLSDRFNQNKFYQWRRGEYLLSPDEQKLVLQVLHQTGVTEDIPFDHYEEGIYW